uniref:Uncharacterized protein n=1 Tax=Coturnix japonica TaxID=93934 RepID=A0A8C2U4F0_COTJA
MAHVLPCQALWAHSAKGGDQYWHIYTGVIRFAPRDTHLVIGGHWNRLPRGSGHPQPPEAPATKHTAGSSHTGTLSLCTSNEKEIKAIPQTQQRRLRFSPLSPPSLFPHPHAHQNQREMLSATITRGAKDGIIKRCRLYQSQEENLQSRGYGFVTWRNQLWKGFFFLLGALKQFQLFIYLFIFPRVITFFCHKQVGC